MNFDLSLPLSPIPIPLTSLLSMTWNQSLVLYVIAISYHKGPLRSPLTTISISYTAGDGDWQPSLCSGAECCVFVLDHCHTCGHTCLVFTHNSHTGTLLEEHPYLWFSGGCFVKQTREISLFYIYLCTHMPCLDLRHTHRYVVRRTPISILVVLMDV